MSLLAVVGMHRSGTSLVAGMLRAIGWDAGPDQELMPPKPDNPRGFVEHLPAVRINDRLLYRLGGTWKRPPPLVPGWERDAALDDLREEAATVAAGLLSRPADRVLLKDPRLSLTLPFWQTVAEIDRAVLVLRAPGPVVHSLLRREDDLDPGRAATLWLRYVLTTLRLDVQLHQVVPSTLVRDVDGVLTKLAVDLGHKLTDDELAAARRQVEDELWGRSSRSRDAETLDGPAIVMAQQVHELLTGDEDSRWRRALGQLTTVSELGAAGALLSAQRVESSATADELRERIASLKHTLAETRERSDRLLSERERARELHDAMRSQRDAAMERIAALENTDA